MTVYDNLMQQIDDAGLLFNVTSHSMLARLEKNEATGKFSTCPIPNKRALINAKSGEVISVVSDRYKVVTNEQIFSSFCKSIENSGVDAEGARVNVSQTASGGRAMVDFVFPAHQLQVAGDDSSTALQMCALNSFDGSHRYAVKAGGLRMKCLNGGHRGELFLDPYCQFRRSSERGLHCSNDYRLQHGGRILVTHDANPDNVGSS